MVYHSRHLCTTVSPCAFGWVAPVPFPLAHRLPRKWKTQRIRQIFGCQGDLKKRNCSSTGARPTWGGKEGACVGPSVPPASPQISPCPLCNCLYVYSALLLQLSLCSIFLFWICTLGSKAQGCCFVGGWGCFWCEGESGMEGLVWPVGSSYSRRPPLRLADNGD